MKSAAVLLAVIALLGATGCSTMYYGTMEKFGVHKRDIFVDRVRDARDSQQDAKQEFENALKQFRSVVMFDGGNLEAKYDKLSKALERSEARAAEVRDRIGAIEDVSQALFREWKAELRQYSSDDLRRRSEARLRETQGRYAELIKSMRRAESRIEPALAPLRDQVLFLKHNLNAKAIAGIATEAATIEAKVDSLVTDLSDAILEADQFIALMGEDS